MMRAPRPIDVICRKAAYRIFFNDDERPRNDQLRQEAVKQTHNVSLQFQTPVLTKNFHADEIKAFCFGRRIKSNMQYRPLSILTV